MNFTAPLFHLIDIVAYSFLSIFYVALCFGLFFINAASSSHSIDIVFFSLSLWYEPSLDLCFNCVYVCLSISDNW